MIVRFARILALPLAAVALQVSFREERVALLDLSLRLQEDDCLQGDDKACREAVSIRREMDELLPTVPVERD